MSTEPATLESLSRQLDALGRRVTHLETRILRWGALLVFGAEAARFFLAPYLAPFMEQ